MSEYPPGVGEHPETYIGDGVYVSFDGYQLWLKTPREGGMHEIAIEPGTFESLLRFARRVWPEERA